MADVDLWYDALRAGDSDPLSVRRFTIREAMSTPFRAGVLARTRNSGVDVTAIVGKPARLSISPSGPRQPSLVLHAGGRRHARRPLLRSATEA